MEGKKKYRTNVRHPKTDSDYGVPDPVYTPSVKMLIYRVEPPRMFVLLRRYVPVQPAFPSLQAVPRIVPRTRAFNE